MIQQKVKKWLNKKQQHLGSNELPFIWLVHQIFERRSLIRSQHENERRSCIRSRLLNAVLNAVHMNAVLQCSAYLTYDM